MESGAPFTGVQNLSTDIVVSTGALSNASSPEYRNKGILRDVTHADPQAQVDLRNGSATNDGSAARTSEARKRQHYARPGHVSFDKLGHVSFDKRSFKLTTLAVESFGRLGEGGYEFIDERRMLQEGEMGDRWHRKVSLRNDFFRSFRWLHR